jgi:hypothetical protein
MGVLFITHDLDLAAVATGEGAAERSLALLRAAGRPSDAPVLAALEAVLAHAAPPPALAAGPQLTQGSAAPDPAPLRTDGGQRYDGMVRIPAGNVRRGQAGFGTPVHDLYVPPSFFAEYRRGDGGCSHQSLAGQTELAKIGHGG